MDDPRQGDIQLRDVRKSFGSVAAVDGVSLDIPDGSFFALLGPSGCGKTTTLRLIAGFESPDSGDILIGGESVLSTPPNRRNVNTVFQQYALFPHMNVAENVAFGLKMKRTPRAEIENRVAEALAMVRLEGYDARKPSELSGGQQQRVALARALINRPAILLLDEPLAALDLKLRRQMRDELKALQHQVGITFLYVTHDQEEAMALSDNIAVMDGGKAQQVGAPEEIYERPRNRFVADFIGASNFLEGEVVGEEDGALRVRLSSRAGRAARLTAWAEPGVSLPSGEPVAVSVRPERVFLAPLESGNDARNAYAATVIERAYLGPDLHYEVELENGVRITSLQPIRDDGGRYATGEAVTVSWRAKDARVLTD